MREETIMLFPTQMILLRSGTGEKSLSNMARAGLVSPALHTNALNDLLFPTWRNCQNAGFSVTSFLLIPLFSPAWLKLYSASCCPSPACHGTYQPQALSGCGWPPNTWAVTGTAPNSHPSCPQPVLCQWLLGKVTHLGSTGKMVTYTLQDLCFLLLWKNPTICQFALVQGPTTATTALLLSGFQPAQQDVCTVS